MRTITYAVNPRSGLVISSVGSEVAIPILEYEKIGEGGDFTRPLSYKLEKVSVLDLAGEWFRWRWTRKIPRRLKNAHRRFWGMVPLKA